MTDDELRRLLGEAAPTAPDGRPVLDTIRPSLSRARRRRHQRQIAGGAAAVAVLVVGIGVAMNRSGDQTELDVRGGPDSVERPSETSDPSPDPPAAPQPPGDPAAGDEAPDHLSPSSTSTVPASTTDTTSTTTTSTSAPPADLPPQQLTRSTEAGSATASVVDGSIVLVEASAAPGWIATTEADSPDELRVDFEQGESRVRVKFDLEDGVLVASIERDGHEEGHEESDE